MSKNLIKTPFKKGDIVYYKHFIDPSAKVKSGIIEDIKIDISQKDLSIDSDIESHISDISYFIKNSESEDIEIIKKTTISQDFYVLSLNPEDVINKYCEFLKDFFRNDKIVKRDDEVIFVNKAVENDMILDESAFKEYLKNNINS